MIRIIGGTFENIRIELDGVNTDLAFTTYSLIIILQQ